MTILELFRPCAASPSVGVVWAADPLVVVVVQMINGNGVSVQAHSYVQLIRWQNTWEQAPGVPATPSPP